MEENVKKEIRQPEMEKIDLLEYVHVLCKKAWLIILCTLVGAVLAGGYTKFFITPQYQAHAMLYVLNQAEGINISLSKQLTVDFMVLAKSRPVINEVIDSLGLNTSYEAVASMVQVANPENSSILKVSVTNSDPELARDVANRLSEVAAEQIAEVMVTDKPSTVEKAVTPKYPISPNMTKNIAKGGILGMGLSIFLICLFFIMDDTIKSEEDMRKYLGINVLAVVPDRELYNGAKRGKNKHE